MTSKQRVFSHSTDINYNDYIKNRNAIEIFKNIKNNQYHNQGNNHCHYPNNIIIKKFANHQDLINFTKTYYKYVNLNKYSLKATKDLYNSNISIVDGNSDVNVINNLKKEKDCYDYLQVLYPESYYVSNDLSGGIYLHFNLDLDKWCVNKTLLDYNKIYNFDNNIINIDGFNGCFKNCANSDDCYNLQSVKQNDRNDRNDRNNRIPQKRNKCKTGMCGNAKPLFI